MDATTTPAPTPAAEAPLVESIEQEQAEWKRLVDENRPVTLKLRTPVKFGRDLIQELVLKPLTMRELNKFPVSREQLTMGHYTRAAGSMANQPPQVMDELTAEDGTRAMMVVELFWQASRRTGARS